MAPSYLEKLANLNDDEIDVAAAALDLATLRQPDVKLQRYNNHLKKLAKETQAHHAKLKKAGAEDDAGTVLAALKHVMVDVHGYHGDQERYDDFDNASLIRVIDRGAGMPITLCIIVMNIAHALGWQVDGLDVPGHFLCRLSYGSERIIFDPFNGFEKLDAAGLRKLIKRIQGEQAELTSAYYEPATNRQILIRLQNNIKYRQIDMEDYKGALKTVESMRLIDPDEYRLLLDAGVLYARTDSPYEAIDALEDYIKLAPHDRDRSDAALLLQQIRDNIPFEE